MFQKIFMNLQNFKNPGNRLNFENFFEEFSKITSAMFIRIKNEDNKVTFNFLAHTLYQGQKNPQNRFLINWSSHTVPNNKFFKPTDLKLEPLKVTGSPVKIVKVNFLKWLLCSTDRSYVKIFCYKRWPLHVLICVIIAKKIFWSKNFHQSSWPKQMVRTVMSYIREQRTNSTWRH